MKKMSFLLTTGLFIFIFAAVIWQWNAFSDNNDKPAESKGNTSIIATVKVEQNLLHVKQTFNDLEIDRQYHAVIPAQASEVKCIDAEGNPCEDGLEQLPKGKKIHFEYMIKSGPGIELFLNNWMIELKDATINKTRIEIVDQYYSRGTWAAGLPLKGYKQTELLHYYVFEGVNSTPSLYWQEKPLNRITGQKGIDYYTAHKDQVIYKFDSLETFSDNHLTVVMTDGLRSVRGNGLLLAGSQLTDKELEQQLAAGSLAWKFQSDKGIENWILDALASLVTKQEPENAKSRAMVEELVKALDSEEIAAFIDYFSKERNLDVNSLDEYLASIKGMNTSFFSMNSQKGPGVFPLLYKDPRSVIVNGEEKDGLYVVIKGDQYLFPLVPTMEALGYNTKMGSEFTTFEISSASNTYYFNIKNKTFIHDGQSFGLLENPFKNLYGEWYLEKQWLKAILKVQISERKDRFMLE